MESSSKQFFLVGQGKLHGGGDSGAKLGNLIRASLGQGSQPGMILTPGAFDEDIFVVTSWWGEG